jgi:hypothetical protein
MNRLRLPVVPAMGVSALLMAALVMPLCGCESLTLKFGATETVSHTPLPTHRPAPRQVETTTTTTVVQQPANPYDQFPPYDDTITVVQQPASPYGHLPQRTSFSPKSSVELKEGCYVGDFTLGSSQIRVTGAGMGKTVIHGNLVLKTQCKVSKLTVTGDVIFEGHQAELVDADFFGRVIDNGMQNRY